MIRLACSILLTWAISAPAIADIFDHRADPADPSLIAVQTRLAAQPVQRGGFEQQKQISGLPIPLLSSGIYVYARDRAVLWQYEQPYRNALMIGPNKVLENDNDSGWQTLLGDAAAANLFGSLFLALLSLDAKQLQESFELYWQQGHQNGHQNGHQDGDMNWTLALKPKPGPLAEQLSTILVTGTEGVDSVLLTDRYGDTTAMQLQAQSIPAAQELDQIFKPLGQ